MYDDREVEIITRTIRSLVTAYWGETIANAAEIDYQFDDGYNPDWYFKHPETDEVYDVSISRSGVIKIEGVQLAPAYPKLQEDLFYHNGDGWYQRAIREGKF